jgi:hypothetical protein
MNEERSSMIGNGDDAAANHEISKNLIRKSGISRVIASHPFNFTLTSRAINLK